MKDEGGQQRGAVWTRLNLKLLKVAKELAAASELRLEHTSAEIAELEEQLRQLRTQRDGQLDAPGRLNSYQPKVSGTDYRCPNCWIVDGKPALLKSIPFERPGGHPALSRLRARLRHLAESLGYSGVPGCLLLALSRHWQRAARCPLVAQSGHSQRHARCLLMTQSGHS